MHSRDVNFLSDGLAIHGKIEGQGPLGVLLLHPHPVYGGTMEYPLLYHLSRILSTKFTVMRFNFRGVGRSQGKFSGDGQGELRDAEAAFHQLCQSIENDTPHVVGYSFGASTALALATKVKTGKIVCFSPSLTSLQTMTNRLAWKIYSPVLVFHGVHDILVTRAEVDQLIPKLETLEETKFEKVETDHFYQDSELRYSLVNRTLEYLLT